ncbi:phosphotransferase [Nocardioides KLBMP 9356]|uniref:Phosphotransferase n=1 Tax=Nocardioides potassii TaxID=2911371 RepID=A0ABS9H7H0_9ACTN|nr:phosphotransferase [Nocardioides potassii]MCF6377162.1 phosphotransferase [Nocardioides potassii]
MSQVVAVAPLLTQAWQVPRAVGGPAEHKADGLLRILGDLGNRYGSAHPAALARAAGLAAELARDETDEVVCHGDPHAGNVLARGDGWAFVDADGFGGAGHHRALPPLVR